MWNCFMACTLYINVQCTHSGNLLSLRHWPANKKKRRNKHTTELQRTARCAQEKGRVGRLSHHHGPCFPTECLMCYYCFHRFSKEKKCIKTICHVHVIKKSSEDKRRTMPIKSSTIKEKYLNREKIFLSFFFFLCQFQNDSYCMTCHANLALSLTPLILKI